MAEFLTVFQSPVDIIGFILFVLIFPVYHGIYPWLVGMLKNQAKRTRFDLFRESWIKRLLDNRDVMAAAQQTRNLTMVNSVLLSSSLILMGLTANFLIQIPQMENQIISPDAWITHPDALRVKLYLLIVAFALAFSFFMTSLRHLGHFVLIIGADSELIAEHQGDPVKYFSNLINRASHRYTLGGRSFYSAFPLFAWLFDPWAFLIITVIWGIKFINFQDFSYLIPRKNKLSKGE